MDAAAELGMNPVSKHQIQPEYGDEQADAVRDQILRHVRGQGNVHFPCSADHEQDWQPYPVDPYSAMCDDHTYIHIPPWEDQCGEWHRMTRMTGPDCAVMCNFINIHTYIHMVFKRYVCTMDYCRVTLGSYRNTVYVLWTTAAAGVVVNICAS